MSDGRASKQIVGVNAFAVSFSVHQMASTQESRDLLLKNTYLMASDLVTMCGITGEDTQK